MGTFWLRGSRRLARTLFRNPDSGSPPTAQNHARLNGPDHGVGFPENSRRRRSPARGQHAHTFAFARRAFVLDGAWAARAASFNAPPAAGGQPTISNSRPAEPTTTGWTSKRKAWYREGRPSGRLTKELARWAASATRPGREDCGRESDYKSTSDNHPYRTLARVKVCVQSTRPETSLSRPALSWAGCPTTPSTAGTTAGPRACPARANRSGPSGRDHVTWRPSSASRRIGRRVRDLPQRAFARAGTSI